jgi:hypothetical protein
VSRLTSTRRGRGGPSGPRVRNGWDPALIRPAIAWRVVLVSSEPQGAAGMHGWAPDVIGAVGTPQTNPQEYLSVFFARSDSSRLPGQAALKRMFLERRTSRTKSR